MTFTMERKEAILTVEDSIRKLQLLDARGKIWAQELIMTVDDKNVQLVDRQTMVSFNKKMLKKLKTKMFKKNLHFFYLFQALIRLLTFSHQSYLDFFIKINQKYSNTILDIDKLVFSEEIYIFRNN